MKHIVIIVKDTEAGNIKEVSGDLFKAYYGKRFCLVMGKFKRPDNWHGLTQKEREQAEDDFLDTTTEWRELSTAGWQDYHKTDAPDTKYRVGVYWKEHLERGGILINAEKADGVESQMKQLAPSFKIRITDDIESLLAGEGLEREERGGLNG